MNLPPFELNYEEKPRKMGVELEFAGLELEDIVDCITATFGGKPDYKGKFVCDISETAFGEYGGFSVELDAALLKEGKLSAYLKKMGIEDASLADSVEDFLADTAKSLVPMEIVSPPIPLKQLPDLEPLREALRKKSAEGTRASAFHAFGLHLNPELPALDAVTIIRFIKAFCAMYPWLVQRHDIDTSRRLTPFIDPFPDKYLKLVLNPSYSPGLETIIDDYLKYNPTRNRPLDFLPLFTWLDRDKVLSVVDDGLTTARPTFHYRLPNCDISNPDWTITNEWNIWSVVERVAADDQKLDSISRKAFEHVQNPVERLKNEFFNRISELTR